MRALYRSDTALSFYGYKMSAITDEMVRLFETRPHYEANGWVNTQCPSCGDSRGKKRLGILRTDTGGFRCLCFNGGCDFNVNPTGWEPGNGFGGRPKELFELLGGDIRDVPISELLKRNTKRYDKTGKEIGTEDKLEIVTRFPEVELPEGTQNILDVYQTNKTARKVYDAIEERGSFFLDQHPFLWTEEYPYYYIIPYLHYGKVVGYLGRHIYVDHGPKRFIQRAASDYMFNQHIIPRYRGKFLPVLESPMDAIALNGVAIRNSRMTEKQINLLKNSGKTPLIIPDCKKQEWMPFVETAKEQGWPVSVPDVFKNCKDVGESIKTYGLLYTVREFVGSQTTNYMEAHVKLMSRGKQ